jgi:hypothetical protein
MKFVVKEGLSVDPRASLARAASVDGALFGMLPIDFFRQRFGEDSSRMEIPEAAADAPMRGDIGDLSREIAGYAPLW